jgi:hypothetical protein
MAENFELLELLPLELLVTSVGTHLYRIGLSHFPYGLERRKNFHYYLLIALLNFGKKYHFFIIIRRKSGIIYNFI